MLSKWGDDGLHGHLRKIQEFYGSRMRALDDAARRHLAGLATWVPPTGGMFLWLKLEGVGDTEELMDELKAEKIAVVPGKYFKADADPDASEFVDCPYFRVAFTVATDEQFDAGMSRLAKILRARRG